MEMVDFFQLEIMCSWAAELLPLYGNSASLKWTWGSLSHHGLVLRQVLMGLQEGKVTTALLVVYH